VTAHAPPAEAANFAREVRAIGDACAAVLAQLDEVLAAQRRGVLALAAASGVDGDAVAAVQRNTLGAEPAAPAPPPPASPAAGACAPADSPPAVAIAALYHSAALSISLAFHNAVAAQQMLGVLAQAVVAQGAAKLLARPGAAAR
jgi:killing trait domain-containing protein